MTAFVEIIFDNHDGRIPIEKTEVAIRRTIGLKKDEYRIDSKAVSHREVINLLESAGLSSSNPYYVVEQGKVSHLTMMKDHERLELMKEVAGTRVYDERRKESMKIMQETDSKKAKIEEVIEYVENRLKELEKEKKELKEFQKLDRDRRSLEYSIYNKQLEESIEKLDKLETSRKDHHDESNVLHRRKAEVSNHLRILERELREAKMQLNEHQKEIEQLTNDKQDKIRSKTKCELLLKDKETKQQNAVGTKRKIQQELDDIGSRIQKTREELKKIDPQYESVLKNEKQLKQKIMDSERRINELYSKQGRQLKFKTVEERNQWINKEITYRQQNIQSNENQIKKLQSDIKNYREEIEKVNNLIREKNQILEQNKKVSEGYNSTFRQLKEKLYAQTNERKELWKKQSEIERQRQKTEDELSRDLRSLDTTVSRSITKGIQEVRRIVRERNISGFHGPVIELFTCDKKYHRAVEVTAGNSLFHLVVDDEKVAATIINAHTTEKAPGRITFIPLAKLASTPLEVQGTKDFIPLVKRLNFDKKFEKAFQQIFSKTYVSKDLQSGAQFARENNVNCVTAKGDQVNRKGALTGGFYDSKQSRLELMENINKSKQTLGKENEEANKMKQHLQDLDKSTTTTLGELQKTETELHKLKQTVTQESLDLRLLLTREKSIRDALTQTEHAANTIQTNQKRLQDSIQSLKSELGTSLFSQLSSQEKEELEALTKLIDGLKREQIQLSNTVNEIEVKRNQLETTLSNNLLIREQELNESADQLSLTEREENSVEDMTLELQGLQFAINDLNQRQKELEEQVEQSTKQIKDLEEQIDQLKIEERNNSKHLETSSTKLEKLLNKRKIILQKKDECIRQIRELGTVPADHEKFADQSMQDLMKRLHTTNEKLKKFGHINKKALDQYEDFSTQREEFLKKKEELDSGAKAIQDLIRVLDQRKDEAIARTFKQVSKNFREIFKKLVPSGSADLVMKKATKPSATTQTSDDEEEGAIQQYGGVSIHAKFTSGEIHTMQQLSGGQKSLVALTLIFAIQKCDPAPFYLFDEVDSALDSAARTAISNMIKSQSNTQFIVTTFKNELVEIADKFYLISHRNKVSSIKTISKEGALAVLSQQEAQLQEGEDIASDDDDDNDNIEKEAMEITD